MRGGIAMLLLAASGLLSVALGAAGLSTVASSYQESDIAISETPESFQAWVAVSAGSEGFSSEAFSEQVASRLLVMPMEKRRDLVVALVQPRFWVPLTPDRQTPRPLQETVYHGVTRALRSAPMAGDLYLAAAWLEARLSGFGTKGREFLRASQLFAPREIPIVVQRLALAPSIWALLNAQDRALVKADLETVRRAMPAQAEKIEAELAAAGVTFP